MKVDAYIIVREINPRGLTSLHRELLGNKPVLHHVIEKAQSIPSLNEVAIICEEIDDFLENCRDVYSVRLHNSTLEDIPRRDRMRRCRRWSVNGWRGGLKYTSVFDEDGWPSAFAAVHESFPCDLIYQIPAEWACLDVQLSEDLIQHGSQLLSSAKVFFHQSSPGLIGTIYTPTSILQMARSHLSLGDGLAVNNKGEENADEAIGPGNFEVSPLLCCNPWRFSVDTPRQLKWVENLIQNSPKEIKDISAEEWVNLAKLLPFASGPSREVEIEWVDDQNHLMDEVVYSNISKELLSHSDTLITIDGRGSWTQHPQWQSYCQQLMREGCHGLHLRLNITELNEELVEKLLSSKATVISIVIDEQHQNQELCALVDKLCDTRDAMNGPLIVVEMGRRKELIPHWEPFWERWFPKVDQLLWRFDGDLNLVRRFRVPCRKLFHELIIQADGTVPLCRENRAPEDQLGKIPEQNLEELSQIAQKKWHEHKEETYQDSCKNCGAWDRLTS